MTENVVGLPVETEQGGLAWMAEQGAWVDVLIDPRTGGRMNLPGPNEDDVTLVGAVMSTPDDVWYQLLGEMLEDGQTAMFPMVEPFAKLDPAAFERAEIARTASFLAQKPGFSGSEGHLRAIRALLAGQDLQVGPVDDRDADDDLEDAVTAVVERMLAAEEAQRAAVAEYSTLAARVDKWAEVERASEELQRLAGVLRDAVHDGEATPWYHTTGSIPFTTTGDSDS